MPLPLLWLLVPVITGTAGYVAKKMMEDDDSSSRRDDDSSYEEERRRQEKAERKARKAEKARKIELLEIDFASTGEKYRQDITCALKDLVSLHFENQGFSHTLRGGFQVGTEKQFSWGHKYLTPEIETNLSFLHQNYAVDISPAAQFKNFNETIDESTSAINDFKHKKLALGKMKDQLKKVAN